MSLELSISMEILMSWLLPVKHRLIQTSSYRRFVSFCQILFSLLNYDRIFGFTFFLPWLWPYLCLFAHSCVLHILCCVFVCLSSSCVLCMMVSNTYCVVFLCVCLRLVSCVWWCPTHIVLCCFGFFCVFVLCIVYPMVPVHSWMLLRFL